VTFRPLTHWPAGRPVTAHRKHATFKASWAQTEAELRDELRLAGARDPVLQVDVAESAIRRDGFVSGQAVAYSPRVVLTFEKNFADVGEPARWHAVTFACDAFWAWTDNVRALALGMGDLRRVERYGLTRGGEQYRGFTAIPASTTATMGDSTAAEVIARRTNFDAAHGRFAGRRPRGRARDGAGPSAAGHTREADNIDRLLDRVRTAAIDYLDWLSEGEARLRSGKSVEWLRARFAGWAASGHAKKDGQRRLYRQLVVPRRANESAARESGRGERARDRRSSAVASSRASAAAASS
jgi:hypothetical protein